MRLTGNYILCALLCLLWAAASLMGLWLMLRIAVWVLT